MSTFSFCHRFFKFLPRRSSSYLLQNCCMLERIKYNNNFTKVSILMNINGWKEQQESNEAQKEFYFVVLSDEVTTNFKSQLVSNVGSKITLVVSTLLYNFNKTCLWTSMPHQRCPFKEGQRSISMSSIIKVSLER